MNGVKTKQKTKENIQLLDRQAFLTGDRWYRVSRRIQDILLSMLALLVLWPVMALIALAIVIDDPCAGPIFAQTRIGWEGREFTFYKFRSMYSGAEEKLEGLLKYNEMDGPAFKIKDDPRITRVGKLLRKTGMDELPQLWNVLKGEMSIVGPRPGLPREVAQYDDYARQRLLVTPGLTCYWQTRPNRNSMSFAEWVELDVQYIKDRSFWTDWKVIAATFGTVLRMDGE